MAAELSADADMSERVEHVMGLLGDEPDEGGGAEDGGQQDQPGESQADAAPGETPASGEDEGQSEPEEGEAADKAKTPEPAIEPPASWSAEDREHFKSLTRPAQEIIQRREKERDAAVQRSQNEAAETKKAVDQDRQRAVQHLGQLTEAILDQIGADFADVKSEADFLKLKSADPQRAAALEARIAGLNAVRQARETRAKAQAADFAAAERTKLEEKLPEIRDPVKRKALNDGLSSMLTEVGYQPEELAQLTDHRAFLVAADALKWRQHQAALKAAAGKKAAPVQRTQRPGSGESGGDAAKRAALMKRAAQASTFDEQVDAVAALV